MIFTHDSQLILGLRRSQEGGYISYSAAHDIVAMGREVDGVVPEGRVGFVIGVKGDLVVEVVDVASRVSWVPDFSWSGRDWNIANMRDMRGILERSNTKRLKSLNS